MNLQDCLDAIGRQPVAFAEALAIMVAGIALIVNAVLFSKWLAGKGPSLGLLLVRAFAGMALALAGACLLAEGGNLMSHLF